MDKVESAIKLSTANSGELEEYVLKGALFRADQSQINRLARQNLKLAAQNRQRKVTLRGFFWKDLFCRATPNDYLQRDRFQRCRRQIQVNNQRIAELGRAVVALEARALRERSAILSQAGASISGAGGKPPRVVVCLPRA
ncbi:hypothetical protein K0U07_03960 [bacterium]|nr:hypothetical protein [bacterium]